MNCTTTTIQCCCCIWKHLTKVTMYYNKIHYNTVCNFVKSWKYNHIWKVMHFVFMAPPKDLGPRCHLAKKSDNFLRVISCKPYGILIFGLLSRSGNEHD